MKKPPFTRRISIIVTGLVLIIALAGGYYWYKTSAQSAAAASAPALQTSKVRTGNLLVSATGSGNVLPVAQADLGFRSNGIVAEVNVVAGQLVKKGDVLARLEDSTQQLAFTQAQANLTALFSPAGLASYQIDLTNAQESYENALADLQYLISPAVYFAEVRVVEAQTALSNLNADASATEVAKAEAQKALNDALAVLESAKYKYTTEYLPAYFTFTWIDTVSGEEVSEIIPPSANDITLARATLEKARLVLNDAQTAYDLVKSGDPAALTQSLMAADGTALAKIKAQYLAYENARLALENARLTAPFDGIVVNINLVPGQSVNTNPVLTLADLSEVKVKFYMDETDLSGLSLGNRVIYTFDAYPETSLSGKVVLIESAMQTVDGSPVVVVWGSLDEQPSFPLLAGMTVEAEVIAGEAQNALIIPVQALRELDTNTYAVFVVQPDGTLKLTPVEIGLRDFANVQILSGLKAGDVVSTGTVETK